MSSPKQYVLYADAQTRAALSGTDHAALLVGGYGGSPNFGDILQAKHAIAVARGASLEPILFCGTPSIPDARFSQRLRDWFGVTAVVFYSWDRIDLEPAGLAPLTHVPRAPYLHLYGGGFLNRHWGELLFSLAEDLHSRFGVGHYVISGQQIGDEMRDRLRTHLDRCSPLTVGCRDRPSLVLAQSVAGDIPVEYTFDDATEQLQLLAAQWRAAPAPRTISADALVHMNMTAHTIENGPHPLDRLASSLAAVHASLERSLGRPPEYCVAQAFSDRCAHQVIDSLACIQALEDRFPATSYRVLHLDKLALELGSSSSARAPAVGVATEGLIAISTSYHVALFCGVLGVPCFLHAPNDYYAQKRAGLGHVYRSLDDFLANPAAPDMGPFLEARARWQLRLDELYRIAPRRAEPAPAALLDDTPRHEWRPKPTILEVAADL
ncbi:MAG: hypothetical protein H7Y88_13150, partial [Phycisphaerales bacterium]|nr:hypothetical protein [Phycisphaerales bacterium]